MAKKGPKQISESHKNAMQAGRVEGKAVREYLDALRNNKPKRGRKRTAETVSARLEAIEDELLEASPIDELKLLQERRNLQAELDSMGAVVDMTALEEAFIGAAAAYSERQGISYGTWREVGVSAATLKAAGIPRTRG
jgi:hypothetical protein